MRSCAACSTGSSIWSYPYLTYQEFLDACGLTEEELDLASRYFDMSVSGLLWNKFFFGILAGDPVLRLAGTRPAPPFWGCPTLPPSPPGPSGITSAACSPCCGSVCCSFSPFSLQGRSGGPQSSPPPPLCGPGNTLWPGCGAALTGTVLQSLAVLLLSAVFYARMFRLVQLGQSVPSRRHIPDTSSGLFPGQRLAAGPPAPLARLPVDAPALPAPAPPPSRAALPVERPVLLPVPPVPGDTGPGLFPARGHVPGPIRAPGCGRGPADRRPAPPFPWRVSHLPHSKIFCLGAPFSGASPSPQCPLTFFLQSFMIDVVARVWRNWQTRWI